MQPRFCHLNYVSPVGVDCSEMTVIEISCEIYSLSGRSHQYSGTSQLRHILIATASELRHSCWVPIFLLYIISIKNLSIATKPRVKPLFCDIYERGNKNFAANEMPYWSLLAPYFLSLFSNQ